MAHARLFALGALVLGLAACGDETNDTDAGAPASDAGVADLGAPDLGSPDLGAPDLGDAGAADAGAADAGDSDGGAGAGPTTYFVIRHTERDPGQDPPINAEGQQRAVRLADALEGAGVDEIITTRFIRGQQSGQVLADRLGLTITVAPIEPTSWPAFAEQVATWQRAREVPGRTYLMIGHAGGYNSTPLRGLGASFQGSQAERYQDFALLVREPDGAVRTAWLQYGGRSSLDP